MDEQPTQRRTGHDAVSAARRGRGCGGAAHELQLPPRVPAVLHRRVERVHLNGQRQ